MNFFMEIAKLRAARVLWARVMTNLGAKDERSKMLRTHCQTRGVSLNDPVHYNNVLRPTLEELAAMLSGTPYLHTNDLHTHNAQTTLGQQYEREHGFRYVVITW